MSDNQEIMRQAREYIKERQFDRARILLEQIDDDPKAREWLQRINELDPSPTNFAEAQEDLDEARRELADAEEDIKTERRRGRRAFTASTALLVFLGSLFGSAIGTIADFGDAVETVNEFRSMFHPELCIVGSDTILGEELGMAQAWAASYEEEHDVRISIDAIGSSNGVRRASDGGCAHVLAMSEPMSDSQFEELSGAGVDVHCAAEIGYDIIVFITDINNPVSAAQDVQLRRFFSGSETNWSSILNTYDFPVTILVRPGSGTTDVVLRRVGFLPNTDSGRDVPEEANYTYCDSNDDCLNRTLSTRGSLYWVSAAWMSTQPPQYLRVLEMIEGDGRSVNPLTEQVNLTSYPRSLQRPLYLYVLESDDASDAQREFAEGFLEYVRGVEGQSILSDNFFYTYFNQPANISDEDVPLPPGFEPISSPTRFVCKPS